MKSYLDHRTDLWRHVRSVMFFYPIKIQIKEIYLEILLFVIGNYSIIYFSVDLTRNMDDNQN